jgi:UDP-N-acetylmuramoyl-tripeptide--D-alanyl-D-alanine ligase
VDALALTAADVAAAAGGRVIHGAPDAAIGRIVIDSRALVAGDCFVAIQGERLDGHAFVPDVVARGAGSLIVARAPADGSEKQAPVVIVVEDTTRALQSVARDVRRRSGASVVAITGSAGKTTTKEVAAEFLGTRHRVFRNKGNLNNHIGLPLSLLELRARPEIAVVELGMNHPGEIRTLVGIAEPDVRVWTNVGDAHLGFFASADAIADAKAEILDRAGADDVLVANADDARIMARAEWFVGKVVTFGLAEGADVRASKVEHRGLAGMSAEISTPAGNATLTTPLLGLGNLANVLAAAAVAIQFEVPVSQIVEIAAGLRPAARRGELLRLPGGVTLIDDSYNSSPAALRQALDTMAAAGGCARKVAVLGEMLELGVHADPLHRAAGRGAAAAGLDLLVTVGGPAAQAMADGAIAAGLPAANVIAVATSEEAVAVALARVRPGDLVLVKGSRGIGTNLVVSGLTAEFA